LSFQVWESEGVNIRIRPATVADTAFHRLMTYEAYYSNPNEPKPSFETAMQDPDVTQYVDGWGRAGDTALVATDFTGKPVGMAWARRYPQEKPSFGYVAPDVPEISIAVTDGVRGQGVGTRLLGALIRNLREAGVNRVSLAVENENPAINLYRRLGFETVSARDGAQIMVLGLGVNGPGVNGLA
jgi:ribosomal protein S18 acetylase RimI-like enzyme